MRALYDTVETHHRGLSALGVDENTYSGIVVPTLLEKIPDAVRLTITRGKDYLKWTVNDLLKALLAEVELRGDYRLNPTLKPFANGVKKRVPEFSGTALQVNRERGKCAFCLGKHRHEDCNKIKDKGEGKNLLRTFGRCFKCLDKGHCARDCETIIKCKICKGGHHSALCDTNLSDPTEEEPPHVESETSTNVVNTPASMLVGGKSRIAQVSLGCLERNSTFASHEHACRCVNYICACLTLNMWGLFLCRIAEIGVAQCAMVKGQNNNRIRVLFDSGSHMSFVTAKAARACDLSVIRREWLSISTFGQKTTESRLRDVVLIDLIPVRGARNLTLEAYDVPEISRISNEHVEVVKKDFSHLRNLWISDVCRTKEELEIDLLIGSDYLWKFQRGQTIRGEPEEPVAIETELGYVLSGPLKPNSSKGGQKYSVNIVADKGVSSDSIGLECEIKRLWDLDSIGIRVSDEVHETFENEVSFNNNIYSVKLPWRQGHDPLPTNYVNSLARMQNQMRKLRKEPEVFAGYDAIIQDQLKSGVIKSVAALEKQSERLHYLPHQAVIRKDAETTKLRIVYDASAKERKNGPSLNDCLHTGPSLNPLLFDILVRFRENKIALVGDIEKAFLNIEIDPKDRDCLRFLWVDDYKSENPQTIVYRFCRVVFGLNASPFLLNATIRHHLSKFAEIDPCFVRRMLEGFYVDDLVSGGNTTEEAFDLYNKNRGDICLRMR